MLEDFILTIVLAVLYSAMAAFNVWILLRIPFVRKSAKRFKRFVYRVSDRVDEACGYYETWK